MFKAVLLAALVAGASAAAEPSKFMLEKPDLEMAKAEIMDAIHGKINATKFLVKEAEDTMKNVSLKAEAIDIVTKKDSMAITDALMNKTEAALDAIVNKKAELIAEGGSIVDGKVDAADTFKYDKIGKVTGKYYCGPGFCTSPPERRRTLLQQSSVCVECGPDAYCPGGFQTLDEPNRVACPTPEIGSNVVAFTTGNVTTASSQDQCLAECGPGFALNEMANTCTACCTSSINEIVTQVMCSGLTLMPQTTTQTTSGSYGDNQAIEYVVPVVSGVTYEFSTCSIDGGAFSSDPYMFLFTGTDPNACSIITADDDTCGLGSKIVWTSPFIGNIVLRLRGYGGSSGTYTMAYKTV